MSGDDLPACARIYVEAFARPPYYEKWTAEDVTELLGVIFARQPEYCFCLEWKGAVAGFILCSTVGRFRAEIVELAVHPIYQSRGWGRHLMDHCISIFRHQGYPRVDLLANLSAPAYTFYRRLGFHQSNHYVLMIKDL
jgi:ribosomal protein S18 acetylase RimI-like enzyme